MAHASRLNFDKCVLSIIKRIQLYVCSTFRISDWYGHDLDASTQTHVCMHLSSAMMQANSCPLPFQWLSPQLRTLCTVAREYAVQKISVCASVHVLLYQTWAWMHLAGCIYTDVKIHCWNYNSCFLWSFFLWQFWLDYLSGMQTQNTKRIFYNTKQLTKKEL